ncbi:unnamed protein product, partial [Ixodes hexagonus]
QKEPGPLEALRQREWLLNMQEHQEIQCLEAAVGRKQAMQERQVSSSHKWFCGASEGRRTGAPKTKERQSQQAHFLGSQNRFEPPDVNVWEERQHRGQPLCGPAPLTPEDESAMLAKALEQSCLDTPPTRPLPEDEEEQLLEAIERSKQDVGPSLATPPSPAPDASTPISTVASPLPGGCSPASECTSASSGGSSHGSGAFPWTSHQREDHWQHRGAQFRGSRGAYHHDRGIRRNFAPRWHGQNGPGRGWYHGQQRGSGDVRNRQLEEDRGRQYNQREQEENWKEKMLASHPGSQSRTPVPQQEHQGLSHRDEQRGFPVPDGKKPCASLAAYREPPSASSTPYPAGTPPSMLRDGLQDLPDTVTVVGTIDARNLMRSKADGEAGDAASSSGTPQGEENSSMSFDQWLSLCGKYMPLLTKGMMEVQRSCVAVQQNMGMNGVLYAPTDGPPAGAPFVACGLPAPHMTDPSQLALGAQAKVMTTFHYDQSRVALVHAPAWGVSECPPYLPGAEFRLSCPPPPLPSASFVNAGFPLQHQQQPQQLQLHPPVVPTSKLNPQAQPFQPPAPLPQGRRSGGQCQRQQRPHGQGHHGQGPSPRGQGRGRLDTPHHGRPRH